MSFRGFYFTPKGQRLATLLTPKGVRYLFGERLLSGAKKVPDPLFGKSLP